MSWPFERGRVYHRRQDIHDRYDGQRQGGIITPSKFPLVIIITGEEGEQHGYADRLRPDGVFEYFGEGQVGDMKLIKGNNAIATHSSEGKSLLLFRKQKGGLRYEGEMICEKHHREQAPDRNKQMRSAIVFELRPLESVTTALEDQARENLPLNELRKRAFEAAAPSVPIGAVLRTIYERSKSVRDYVLARAEGKCEGCTDPSPFRRVDGTPYLEPHHIRRASDGGPDSPKFVISLCPNCHRRVHSGDDGSMYNGILLKRMAIIEP